MYMHEQAWDPGKLFISTNIRIHCPQIPETSDSFDHDFRQSQNHERNIPKEEWLFSRERTQKYSFKSLWVTNSKHFFVVTLPQ